MQGLPQGQRGDLPLHQIARGPLLQGLRGEGLWLGRHHHHHRQPQGFPRPWVRHVCGHRRQQV